MATVVAILGLKTLNKIKPVELTSGRMRKKHAYIYKYVFSSC